MNQGNLFSNAATRVVGELSRALNEMMQAR